MSIGITHYSELERGNVIIARMTGGAALITGCHELQQNHEGYMIATYADGSEEQAAMPHVNLAEFPDWVKTVSELQRISRNDPEEIAYRELVAKARASCK